LPTIDKKDHNGVSTGEQYLTIKEVAERLKLSPKTIKNKMASGAFRQGVHYFRPPGMQVRFKWSAVVAWLEQEEIGDDHGGKLIPMPRSHRQKGSKISAPV
jgi:excisionase family DNA binding protein